MVPVRLVLPMVQLLHCSLFLVRIGLTQMVSKVIHSMVCFIPYFVINIQFIFLMTAWTTDPSDQIMLAFSLVSNTEVLLPAADDNASLLNIVAYIYDTFDCMAQFNMTPVFVELDMSELNTMQTSVNNSFIRMLASGGQNIISQIITLVLRQFNTLNNQAIEIAQARKCIHPNLCMF
jgi:hypothetical protein